MFAWLRLFRTARSEQNNQTRSQLAEVRKRFQDLTQQIEVRADELKKQESRSDAN